MGVRQLWFTLARKACVPRSTCAKTRTGAVIVKWRKVIAAGWNMCALAGISYGEAVAQCPREAVKTGAEYELCGPVHAEVVACLNVRSPRKPEEFSRFASHREWSGAEIRAAFTKEELLKLQGGRMYIVGHYWACEGCLKFLQAVGITDIRLDPMSGKEARMRYRGKGIQ